MCDLFLLISNLKHAFFFHHWFQAQSEEDDSPQDVALNMDGFMEEFFEQVRFFFYLMFRLLCSMLVLMPLSGK